MASSGADEETILGALLHDVGRFIPAADKMPAMIAADGTYVGKASHEVLGERYLRQLGFSEKICQLVGAHVMAKRYLTAVDKAYYDGLSQSSKTTLKFQVCNSKSAEFKLLTDMERAARSPKRKSKPHKKIPFWKPNSQSEDGMIWPKIQTSRHQICIALRTARPNP